MQELLLIEQKLPVFLLAFFRIGGLMVIAPVFSARVLPQQLRIAIALILAALVTISLPPQQLPAFTNIYGFVWLAINEFTFGLALGFVIYLVFAAISLAGEMIDLQIGLSMATLVDPTFGQAMPLIGNFKNMLAVLIFLLTDSHHLLVMTLIKSFTLLKPGQPWLEMGVSTLVFNWFPFTVITGLQIALPVVGVLLVVDIALGILARTVPQMNIFVVGLPLKIFIGLIFLMLSLPLYVKILNQVFWQGFDLLATFMHG